MNKTFNICYTNTCSTVCCFFLPRMGELGSRYTVYSVQYTSTHVLCVYIIVFFFLSCVFRFSDIFAVLKFFFLKCLIFDYNAICLRIHSENDFRRDKDGMYSMQNRKTPKLMTDDKQHACAVVNLSVHFFFCTIFAFIAHHFMHFNHLPDECFAMHPKMSCLHLSDKSDTTRQPTIFGLFSHFEILFCIFYFLNLKYLVTIQIWCCGDKSNDNLGWIRWCSYNFHHTNGFRVHISYPIFFFFFTYENEIAHIFMPMINICTKSFAICHFSFVL